MSIKRIVSGVLSALFPKKCVSCRALITDGFLCYTCKMIYAKEITDGCLSCGREHPFCVCAVRHMENERLIYCIPYKERGVSRDMLLRLKRGKHALIADELTDRLAAAMRVNGIGKDWTITYVPRAPAKRRRAGVDQTKELAYMLARKTGLECTKTLICRDLYREQKHLSLSARKTNADRRFHLKRRAKSSVKGRKILLIDDIVTSGASAKRCIELLREAGAADVVCLAAGRSVKYL